MNEFVCPNGRMSVNGVCPIFEGDDGQIKDIKKTSTYDAIKEDEITEKDKEFFEFDFEKPTESAFESAGKIISNNIKAYDSFVEEKLGIPTNVQNVFRLGATIATGSLVPFAIPFLGGAALNYSDNTIENKTMQDTQGDVQTFPIGTMNIQPTNRDIAMGGGSFNQPDGSGGYTGGYDSSTGNYNDPYDPGYAD